jgi:hypothetical protein
MLELALDRQEDLVLKPAIGHGTLGVTCGRAVSHDAWRLALQSAADDVYVLQERVVATPEPVPVLENGAWCLRDYDVNWGVFIHQRRFAGAMLRALPSTHTGVISLGAGGAVGCCFHNDGGDPR